MKYCAILRSEMNSETNSSEITDEQRLAAQTRSKIIQTLNPGVAPLPAEVIIAGNAPANSSNDTERTGSRHHTGHAPAQAGLKTQLALVTVGILGLIASVSLYLYIPH